MYIICTRYNKKAIILLIYSMRRIYIYTYTHTKVEYELCSNLLTFDKYVDESDIE